MEFVIPFLNPCTNEKDCIKYNFDRISYSDWRTLSSMYRDKNPINVIKDLLRWHSAYNKGLNHETIYNSFAYEKSFILPVLYGLLAINDPFIYNKLVREIVDTHKENIIIFENDSEIKKIMASKPKTKKSKLKNKFYRQEQYDIFGNIKYIYVNPKTEEVIESDNPDLLEELNKPKRKTKAAVPISSMTFSFKKK